MKQCDKGHFYDEGRYLACPYCQNAEQPLGKTVAAVQGGSGAASVGKTMPVQNTPGPAERG